MYYTELYCWSTVRRTKIIGHLDYRAFNKITNWDLLFTVVNIELYTIVQIVIGDDGGSDVTYVFVRYQTHNYGKSTVS